MLDYAMPSTRAEYTMNTKITLDVTGMTCDGCEGHVGDALAAAGLEDLEVDWRRGFAAGTDTGSFDVARAREALDGSNYEIVSVSSPESDPATTASSDDVDSDYDLLILFCGVRRCDQGQGSRCERCDHREGHDRRYVRQYRVRTLKGAAATG
jgi:copper chaperone CopZ